MIYVAVLERVVVLEPGIKSMRRVADAGAAAATAGQCTSASSS